MNIHEKQNAVRGYVINHLVELHYRWRTACFHLWGSFLEEMRAIWVLDDDCWLFYAHFHLLLVTKPLELGLHLLNSDDPPKVHWVQLHMPEILLHFPLGSVVFGQKHWSEFKTGSYLFWGFPWVNSEGKLSVHKQGSGTLGTFLYSRYHIWKFPHSFQTVPLNHWWLSFKDIEKEVQCRFQRVFLGFWERQSWHHWHRMNWLRHFHVKSLLPTPSKPLQWRSIERAHLVLGNSQPKPPGKLAWTLWKLFRSWFEFYLWSWGPLGSALPLSFLLPPTWLGSLGIGELESSGSCQQGAMFFSSRSWMMRVWSRWEMFGKWNRTWWWDWTTQSGLALCLWKRNKSCLVLEFKGNGRFTSFFAPKQLKETARTHSWWLLCSDTPGTFPRSSEWLRTAPLGLFYRWTLGLLISTLKSSKSAQRVPSRVNGLL